MMTRCNWIHWTQIAWTLRSMSFYLSCAMIITITFCRRTLLQTVISSKVSITHTPSKVIPIGHEVKVTYTQLTGAEYGGRRVWRWHDIEEALGNISRRRWLCVHHVNVFCCCTWNHTTKASFKPKVRYKVEFAYCSFKIWFLSVFQLYCGLDFQIFWSVT